MGIVDGWTNPYYQATAYAEFAYAAGLIDPKTRDIMSSVESQAKIAFLNQQYVQVANLFGSLTDYVAFENINVYNYREYNDNMGKKNFHSEFFAHIFIQLEALLIQTGSTITLSRKA